ncbi:histidine kinase [Brevibacillus brevis]|uniref:cache domain-containing sensor histidine kinase n=1 Tax=Brevibacillus brevis TaxID=1393 RepID=UPI00190239B3|nr:sensor histidine kinase [Brevibacillus brevis]MBH0333219.1 histidine kinase [Brevibacillus brevis]
MKRKISMLFLHGTLRTKILTLFLCLIAIPLSLQGIITYNKFSISTEIRTADYTGQIVGQINHNLERNIREMKRLSLMPLYDPEVLSILKEIQTNTSATSFLSMEKREKMTLYISSLSYSRPEVKGIQIIAGNGMIFSNLDPSVMKSKGDMAEEGWYSRVIKEQGGAVIIPQHRPSYYLDASGEHYVSVARLLREPYTKVPLGIMKIDMKMDMFDQILSDMPFTKDGSLIIVNEGNELFYEKRESEGSPGYRTLLQETDGINRGDDANQMMIQGQRYLFVDHQSRETGLVVISLIPLDILLAESNSLRSFTMLIAAMFLLVAGGLAIYFSYSLSKPLVQLKEKMLQVKRGNFHERVPVDSQDEIGKLSEQFNQMVEEINRLVNEVYLSSLREREAELAALQSQINPHFIYNTLESINMMAIRSGNYDVSDMVSSLGKLMRYTVAQEDGHVPLTQELMSLESYVRIQRIRLGERLQVYMDVEESLSDQRIPKLLLQPLLENAIAHGIEHQEQGGTIWLTGLCQEGVMQISVRDNGKGMSEQTLSRLLASLRTPVQQYEMTENAHNGTALRNISHRLTLLFGDEYGLTIVSGPDQGTEITMKIPLDFQKGESRHVQSTAGRR